MGIGERLKQERELKNISLDEVQKVTKIQARYLDAIENERFEVMPGSFYVRAFIKEYANALGLDAEELMEEYKNDLPFEKEENIALSRVKSSKKNKAAVNTPVIFSFLPSMIVVLLIVGIIVLVWLFNQITLEMVVIPRQQIMVTIQQENLSSYHQIKSQIQIRKKKKNQQKMRMQLEKMEKRQMLKILNRQLKLA